MKKLTLVFCLALVATCAQAGLILSDDFTYPDGNLTTVSGGIWSAHSGAGSNPLAVTNGMARVRGGSGGWEDVNAALTGAPYLESDPGATLFASFSIIISNAAGLPGQSGTYFAHFRGTNSGAATDFGGRVFVSTTNAYTSTLTPAGYYRVSIGNGTLAGPESGQFDLDLQTNVVYQIVTRFVPSTGVATLWVNPNTITDPSVTATDAGSVTRPNPFNVFTYAIRQGAGLNLFFDNLKVGTAFNDVAGGNTSPLISSVSTQSIPANTSTGPVAFTVQDAESPAASLTVVGSSDNQILIPNANIILGGSGMNRTVTIAPASGQQGVATVTLTVSDGVNSSVTAFLVRVGFPTISLIPNLVVLPNTSSGPVAFTIADAETPVGSLTLAGASSDQVVIPDSGIVFGGSGSARTVTITPAPSATGVATITVTVSDGVNSAVTPFVVVVPPPTGIILQDDFSYADGSPLWLQGPWSTHASPTGTNFSQLLVVGGAAEMNELYAEDLAADLTGGPYLANSGAIFYFGFTLRSTALPTSAGDYFLHLKDSSTGTTFRGKFYVNRSGVPSGYFRAGIANGANSVSVQYPADLVVGNTYGIVVRYNSATAETKLWVNPVSEASPSVAAVDPTSTTQIGSFGLRSTGGIGTNYIDRLVVSSSFATVNPGISWPAAPALNINKYGSDVVLSWSNPAFVLQSAPAVSGTYTNIPGATSPYTNSTVDSAQFFRLKY